MRVHTNTNNNAVPHNLPDSERCAPATNNIQNHFLSRTSNHKCVTLPPDGYHLAFLRLKISKAIDKKRLGKACKS
jgi:hypothetical protein